MNDCHIEVEAVNTRCSGSIMAASMASVSILLSDVSYKKGREANAYHISKVELVKRGSAHPHIYLYIQSL